MIDLDAAAADPDSPAWNALPRESAALLPWLAQTCAAFPEERRDMVLTIAGSIAVDASDAERITYADEIAVLRALAVNRMQSAATDSVFVHLQQAVLAFDGDELWGKELDRLNAGEVDLQCPECDEELLIALTSEDGDIEPGLSSDLAARLHAKAVEADHDEVAIALTYLFGRVTCPACGTRFDVSGQLAGAS